MRDSRVTLALAGVVLLAVLAGCGGSKPTAIKEPSGPNLVLPSSVLRPPFVQFGSGKVGYAYRAPGLRGDPFRFGRVGGWVARFRRPGTNATPGPIVIDSNADLFKKESGARQDFAAIRAEAGRTYPRIVTMPPLGDEAFARSLVTGTGAFAVRYYSINWRRMNVVAVLTVNGFKVTVAQALKLARSQDRAIVGAANRP